MYIYIVVTSCRDLPPPAGTWVTRRGDTMRVKCNSSADTWHLTCSGREWAGSVGNCSESGSEGRTGGNNKRTSAGLVHFPFGTRKIPQTIFLLQYYVYLQGSSYILGLLSVVALGVAIGVLIGGSLLSLVVVFQRRLDNYALCLYSS